MSIVIHVHNELLVEIILVSFEDICMILAKCLVFLVQITVNAQDLALLSVSTSCFVLAIELNKAKFLVKLVSIMLLWYWVREPRLVFDGGATVSLFAAFHSSVHHLHRGNDFIFKNDKEVHYENRQEIIEHVSLGQLIIFAIPHIL